MGDLGKEKWKVEGEGKRKGGREGRKIRTVNTGLCIVTKTPNQNINTTFTSSNASFNCAIEKDVLSPPSFAFAILRRRISRSRTLRNQASVGPVGISV